MKNGERLHSIHFTGMVEEGENKVNRRTCPSCGEKSYSSCSGTIWDCPYCGYNLGDAPNELCSTRGGEDTMEQEFDSDSIVKL